MILIILIINDNYDYNDNGDNNDIDDILINLWILNILKENMNTLCCLSDQAKERMMISF